MGYRWILLVLYYIFHLQYIYVVGVEENGQWLWQSEKKWDQEWSKGAWDYMETVAVERSREAVIGGVFAHMFVPLNGSVLDIGCGEGAISDYLLPSQKMHYVGVDISKEAVRIAKTKRKSPLKFVHAQAHMFQPTHKFDMIIFSEMLYYVEHEKILAQYGKYLTPNGVIVISIFYRGEKLLYEHIFKFSQSYFLLVDEIDVLGYTKKSATGSKERTAFHIEVYRLKS